MKTLRVIKLLVALAGFTALATPGCYGQSDVDPDHFDLPTIAPFPQPKSKEGNARKAEKVRFDGNVTLPYTLTCAGKRLLPGRYAFSLPSEGKTGRAILNQRGQITEIAGVVRRPADPHARNVLVVECSGKAHRLSAAHVKEMELVFDSGPQVEHPSDDKPRRTEELRLTRVSPQK
jgi:hypothetical protein